MMIKKRTKQLLLGIFGVYLAYMIIVLVHGTVTDYQPEAKIELTADQNTQESIIQDSILSFAIWNVGYGGLGAESDFFYHQGNLLYSGGMMVRTPRNFVEKNIKASADFVRSTQADFFLFQEIDVHSKRSFFINQYEQIAQSKPGLSAYYAANYQSDRVPIPILQPWMVYGKVNSGLASYSIFQPTKATRYQLPGEFSWPTRIFQLDRCLLVQRFNHANGKELVVINLHNSAYDSDGSLKKLQMDFLREKVMQEYEQGNYVIVGGDWNQCPPYFAFDTFKVGETYDYTQINITPEFLPDDWRWVYDPTTATNRKINMPFDKEKSFTTLIDFFLISPNIQVKQVRCIKQDFQFSDHQPVWMEIELL